MHPSRSSLALALALALPVAGMAPGAARAEYVQPHIQHASYGDLKVVVPLTSADPAIWGFKLKNVLNGLKGAHEYGGTLHATIVLYGPGVKMLAQPMDDNLQEMVEKLRAAGVRFAICNNTLKGMNLDWHTLDGVQESDIVPAGFLEVGWLASQGWAVEAGN